MTGKLNAAQLAVTSSKVRHKAICKAFAAQLFVALGIILPLAAPLKAETADQFYNYIIGENQLNWNSKDISKECAPMNDNNLNLCTYKKNNSDVSFGFTTNRIFKKPISYFVVCSSSTAGECEKFTVNTLSYKAMFDPDSPEITNLMTMDTKRAARLVLQTNQESLATYREITNKCDGRTYNEISGNFSFSCEIGKNDQIIITLSYK